MGFRKKTRKEVPNGQEECVLVIENAPTRQGNIHEKVQSTRKEEHRWRKERSQRGMAPDDV